VYGIGTTCVSSGVRRILSLLLCGALQLGAEQLITRTFSTSDGLAGNTRLGSILQDSHGFIWIATLLGISRFDGQQFQNFTTKDGLGYALVNNVVETRNKEVWVATNGGGVARYEPQGRAGHQFVSHPTGSTPESNSVNSIREGPDGTLWAATDGGVYRLDPGSREFRLDFIPPPLPGSTSIQEVIDTLPEAGNVLWIASNYQGLFRRNADGSVDQWAAREGIPIQPGCLFRDRADALWLVTTGGALTIDRRALPGRSPILARLEPSAGNRGHIMGHMIQDVRGEYWITGQGGVFHFNGHRLQLLGRREGVPGEMTWGLMEDRDGNLWVGVEGAGVMRIVRNPFTAWSVEDGLAKPTVVEVSALSQGGVAAVTWDQSGLRIQRFQDPDFRDLTPPIPVPGLAEYRPVLGDHLGDVWVATERSVDRFRQGRLVHRYSPAEGWPGGAQGSLSETRSGDIWLARWQVSSFLGRWKRDSNRLESMAGVPGSPAAQDPWIVTEDADRNIWVVSLHGGLFRYRHGAFVPVPSPFPQSGRFQIHSLHVDDAGRIWIGYTQGRLGLVESPNDPQPRIRPVEFGGGSVESAILSLTSDSRGRLYVGSAAGLWLYDPSTGQSASYAGEIPILSGPIRSAARDRNGDRLWFGTDYGLVRFSPPKQTLSPRPRVRLTQVQLTDGLYPISGWGEETVRAPRFPDWQNRLEFSFSGISGFGRLRFSYRLEPQDREWSAATLERTVIYPRLPAGGYRFAVRAIDPAGNTSARAASFSFEIAAPLWQRWWFLLLAALALAGSIYAAWRFRLNQLLAVERVRMRIATDLHDDIGSALSQIGLLSEAARRQAGAHSMPEALARIATVSRETASSMADIVWTINPQRDSLGDLSARIRRFASELFSARDIDCVVVTPPSDEDLKLDIDTRRQLLLVAKEAMHNVVRHARSTQVSIELKHESRWVVFRIHDNGAGFDPQASADGHGIASMRSRAEGLGGELLIDSGNGSGTSLEVRIPK
jgi:signal transduction histidine kinase/ligand-binding sensor domain-containing protein